MVDQRAQQRRAVLHGRPRGFERPDVVEHGRRPGEPRRRRPSHDRAHRSGRTRVPARPNSPATLLVRPRGWHLPERHLLVDGSPVSGSLFDFGLAFVHNAREQLERGTGPVRLPPEARGPSRGAPVERRLRVVAGPARDRARHDPRDRPDRDDPGRVRDGRDPVRAARALGGPERRTLGLHLQRDQEVPAPSGVRPARPRADHDDRPVHARVHRAAGADVPPARRARDGRDGGVHPEPPGPRGERDSRSRRWREDKEREANAGFDGTWVAHPDLVETAMAEFDRVLGDRPNQIERRRDDVEVSAEELLDVRVPGGEITEAGLGTNVNVGLRYLASWLSGVGAAAIDNLMEDAATAEISRSQIWQWVAQRRQALDRGAGHRGAGPGDDRDRDRAASAAARGGVVRRAPLRGGAGGVRAGGALGGVRRVPDAPRVRAAR